MKLQMLLTLLVLVFAQVPNTQKKINDINVLMPLIYEKIDKDGVSQRTVQHTLEAYGGCYKWFSSRKSVLEVVSLIDSEICDGTQKQLAYVQLKTNEEFNYPITITAQDKETQDQIKVEAKISKISRIEILTQFRTIDVGDMEQFQVIGYDSEGNSFSTLQGLRFDWSISDTTVLERIQLKDSTFKATDLRKKLESQSGFQTDQVVGKGLKTGFADVSVKLKEQGYNNIHSTVRIQVQQQITLYPDFPLFVLPYQIVNFQLLQINKKENKKTYKIVQFPNNIYKWSIDNQLASISSSGVYEALQQQGPSIISVSDQQITKSNKLIIVTADQIVMHIKEFSQDCWENNDGIYNLNLLEQKNEGWQDNWYLIKGHTYYIKGILTDSQGNQIQITQNVKIEFNYNKDIFTLVEQRNHQIVLKVKKDAALKQTPENKIKVIFPNVQGKETYTPEKEISQTQKPFIISQIQLIKPSSIIHLPYIQNNLPLETQQEFQLTALGGSQKYQWHTLCDKLQVTKDGVLYPKNFGKCQVIVQDKTNILNEDSVDVLIGKIDRVYSIESVRELESNTIQNDLFVTAESNGKKFSNCTNLQFGFDYQPQNNQILLQSEKNSYENLQQALDQLNQNNKIIQNIINQDNEVKNIKIYQEYLDNKEISQIELQNILKFYTNYGICRRVFISAISKSEVSAKFTITYPIGNNLQYQSDEFNIYIYDSYETKFPNLNTKPGFNDIILITPQSSFQWQIEGGPYVEGSNKTPNLKQTVYNKKNEKSNALTILPLESKPFMRKYYITCKQFQEQKQDLILEVEASNQQTPELPRPIVIIQSIQVICAIPKALKIIQYDLNIPTSNLHLNTQAESTLLKLNNAKQFGFWVKGVDNQERPFYNISSLNFKWTLEDQSYGIIKNFKFDKRIICEDCQSDFVNLELESKQGTTKLICSSSQLKEGQNNVFKPITDDLQIQLFTNHNLNQNELVLFNSLLNKQGVIDIFNGSGLFNIEESEKDILLREVQNPRKLQLIPKKVGTTIVTVTDNQLLESEPRTVKVRVAGVKRIQLLITKKYIQIGKTTELQVKVFDEYNYQYPNNQLQFMNLQIESDGKIDGYGRNYSIKKSNENPSIYFIQAININMNQENAIFGFEAVLVNFTGDKIKSEKVHLEIFQPLKTIPENILITANCNLALQLTGGPKDNTQIFFKYNQDNEILNIQQLDRQYFNISAYDIKEGTHKIRFELILNENGNKELIAETEVNVKVTNFNRLEILNSNDRTIHQGTQIRLVSLILRDNLQITPALCPIKYYWTSKSEILQLSSDSGYFQSQVNSIGVNATAVGTGVAQIYLKIVSESKSNPITLTKTININIIQPLSYLSPTYIQQQYQDQNLLLLPPNSEFQLELKQNQQFKIAKLCDNQKNIDVDSHGLIKIGSEKHTQMTLEIKNSELEASQILLNLYVTPIYSIFVENSFKLLEMQTESEMVLQVELQDVLGRSFPSNLQKVELQFITTNDKIVKGGFITQRNKQLLTIKGKFAGKALVTVFLVGNSNIYDSFFVQVGSVIRPGSPVYVHKGGEIAFQTSSQQKRQDSWKSENPHIIQINPVNGKAVAQTEGIGYIVYNDSELKYTTKVYVMKITQANIESVSKQISDIQNSPNYKELYQFQISATGKVQKDDQLIDKPILNYNRQSNLVNNNLRIICRDGNETGWFKFDETQYKQVEDRQIPICQLQIIENSGRLPQKLNLQVDFQYKKDNSYETFYTATQEYFFFIIQNHPKTEVQTCKLKR